jgi:hypothetical protein
VYLSNAEREALGLLYESHPDAWVVAQAIDQARLRGAYIPGEESLLIRLADAEDYEARMQAERDKENPQPIQEAQEQAPEAVEVESPAEEAPEAVAAEETVAPIKPAILSLARLGGSEPVEEVVPFDPGPDPVLDQDFTTFTKAQLIDFAAEQFGKRLDPGKRKDSLIAEVQTLVDAGR